MTILKNYNNKTKAAFVLLIAMLIILLSNFNTLQNSKKTNENINAIYNDRLVVANYIFQYTNELHTIKANAISTSLTDTQKTKAISTTIKNIQNIDLLYLKTVLTSNEKTSFENFLSTCSTINKASESNNWNLVNNSSDKALQTLEQLSQIQIDEGKSKLAQSNKLHEGNAMMGELEIALLVILSGLSLYLLMIKKNKINLKMPEAPGMN
ncbi:MCP four helix bundle domain-containing protein [Flavobacterium sp.]|uniref:MCP four helix bundle domain-containing protein n=1 Tax=Flavobacterium sp. TaxID=239 RepID=UPI003C6389DF